MKKNRLVPTSSAQDIRQEIVSDSELRQVWYKISDVERILDFFCLCRMSYQRRQFVYIKTAMVRDDIYFCSCSCMTSTGFLALSITFLVMLPKTFIEDEILLLAITIKSTFFSSDRLIISSYGGLSVCIL